MKNSSRQKMPSQEEIRAFRNGIIKWFEKNRRIYPWRRTKNPFRILIAEMMLQRTKSDQVEAVYRRFFSVFKSPRDVASSTMRELNCLLYPLGLRWRIKRFREVSRSLIKDFRAKVPSTRNDILKLPGVGDYVAGIVLSTAFGKREWIVDSNVVRVFKRYFGIRTSKEGRRDRHVIDIARTYVSKRKPGRANLAFLDFAALICIPGKPKCSQCPLSKSCYSQE